MNVLRQIWKAVAAGLSAGIGAYVVANQVGGVTEEEWYGIVGAVLFAFVATFLAPKNQQPDT